VYKPKSSTFTAVKTSHLASVNLFVQLYILHNIESFMDVTLYIRIIRYVNLLPSSLGYKRRSLVELCFC